MNNTQLELFKLLRKLKEKPMLDAIFQASSARIELTEKQDVIGYVSPDGLGYKIVLNLSNMVSPRMALFVLAHEIMHIYFSHFNFLRADKQLDNIAKDYAINHFLANELEYSLADLVEFKAITIKYIADHYGTNETSLFLSLDSSSMEVYDFIYKQKTEKQKNAPQNEMCQTDTSVGPSDKSTNLFKEKLAEKLGQDENTLSELADLEKRVNESSKKQGNESGQGYARQLLEKLNGPSSKKIASILLNRVIANNAARFTSKRSSRRDDTIDARIKEKNNSVCFVIDTSGSISDRDLTLINQVIDSASKIASITVRCGDTELRNEKALKKNEKLDKSFFKGGGGTDLNFSKKQGDKFLHYLIFTDGHIPDFNEKFKRTLFIFEHGSMLDNEKCYRLKD